MMRRGETERRKGIDEEGGREHGVIIVKQFLL
jgi:hypothetical protein